MAAILEVTHVNQKFHTDFWVKPTHVLKDLSLSVPERSIMGFLGSNGAGKNTLIHLIVGLKKPSTGTVTFRGLDTSTALARSKIGYLPERSYFHEHLTGERLLKYFGALSGMSGSVLDDRITSCLNIVNMKHARNVELRNYSKGMLQRIGIAQAILHDPEFLVLDEPMSGLDPVGRKEIRELILHFASEGRTVFLSSHVIPDVEAICDQVALIQAGRLIGCGPISKFLSQGTLSTEVGFSGIAENELKKNAVYKKFSMIRDIPEGFRGVVSGQEELNPVLNSLLKLDAQILWVNPLRPSLEDFFKKENS